MVLRIFSAHPDFRQGGRVAGQKHHYAGWWPIRRFQRPRTPCRGASVCPCPCSTGPAPTHAIPPLPHKKAAAPGARRRWNNCEVFGGWTRARHNPDLGSGNPDSRPQNSDLGPAIPDLRSELRSKIRTSGPNFPDPRSGFSGLESGQSRNRVFAQK